MVLLVCLLVFPLTSNFEPDDLMHDQQAGRVRRTSGEAGQWVAHTNPSTCEAEEADLSESEDNLVYKIEFQNTQDCYTKKLCLKKPIIIIINNKISRKCTVLDSTITKKFQCYKVESQDEF